ncbi:hypothetical protein [Thalassotalea crassostreae]|uniref:hypothetical protein n=1 Tax=Thalassotalea crassostreae TaxID=1763536 RepID=UPI0008399202|nr:hypothetical protein [Thalassotalea crassostreae]
MKLLNVLLSILLNVVFSITIVFSANAEETKKSFSYATYFVCETENEKTIDELIDKVYSPFYDGAVKDGTINSWGWLAHQTGGNWRRILYHTSDSVSQLLKAQKVIGERMSKAIGDKPDALARGCSTHDDYIWQSVTGSSAVGTNMPRGNAGLSTYFECSFMGEESSDEIFKNHFAPIYNANVGKGKLTSWGWLSHVIGGKYRRLLTLTAEDYDDLLASQENILKQIYDGGDNKHAMEFVRACTSHTDYLWDIQKETP